MDDVRMKIKRKSETDEWLVVVTVNGKRHEGRTYYTDDRDDARCTMQAMENEGRAQGERVNGLTIVGAAAKMRDAFETKEVK